MNQTILNVFVAGFIFSFIFPILIQYVIPKYFDPTNKMEVYYVDLCKAKIMQYRYAILVINNNEYPIDGVIFDFKYSSRVKYFALYPENNYKLSEVANTRDIINFETKPLSNSPKINGNNCLCLIFDIEKAINPSDPSTNKMIKFN
ncbi:MAG: hypothetical protein NTX32_02440, partial [Candidatus Firestonebacteria bacterium]|nr:hypothetical protein [Candidatus Firestonebacteria bacterium]